MLRYISLSFVGSMFWLAAATAQPERGARMQPGTEMGVFTPKQGDYVIELDRFHEFSPCQDGGIAAFLFEHGDSGLRGLELAEDPSREVFDHFFAMEVTWR